MRRIVFRINGVVLASVVSEGVEWTASARCAVPYVDLPEAEYRAALVGAGVPGSLAALLADSDAAASNGALFDDGHALSRLIGRPTTPFAAPIAAAIKP